MEVTMNPTGVIKPNWQEIISAPIPAEKVKWKVQTNHKDGKYVMYVCYLDSRMCTERLSEAFGGAWSDMYEDKVLRTNKGEVNYTECTLSVNFGDHITVRRGRGSAADIEPEKSSESNSLKRAAGKFGFGSELYDLPKVLVEAKKNGNYTNTLCSKSAMNKALRQVPIVYAESAEALDFVWIDDKGNIYSVNDYMSKGDLLWSVSSTTKTTKTVKKKVVKEEPKKEEAPVATAKPALHPFPEFNDKVKNPVGGPIWGAAIRSWNGVILTSKPDANGNTFKYVMLEGYQGKDTKSFHKISEHQEAMLKELPKYKA